MQKKPSPKHSLLQQLDLSKHSYPKTCIHIKRHAFSHFIIYHIHNIQGWIRPSIEDITLPHKNNHQRWLIYNISVSHSFWLPCWWGQSPNESQIEKRSMRTTPWLRRSVSEWIIGWWGQSPPNHSLMAAICVNI